MCVHMQAIKISSDEIFIISCAYSSKHLNIYQEAVCVKMKVTYR